MTIVLNGPFAAVSDLERHLGPVGADGPLGKTACLAHDREESFPQAAAEVLDAWGLCHYYVPQEVEGGRIVRYDSLLTLLRSLARRDLTITIGHCKTFLGAIPVWVGGSDAQKRRLARFILSRQPVSLALTERAHGSDLVGNDVALTEAADGGLRINGEKWLINNATRSGALSVYANSGDVRTPRSGNVVLVFKADLPEGSWRALPKVPTHGIRGADISGIAFADAPVDASAIVGEPGKGLDVVLKSLQVTRTLCAGLSLGAAEQALNAAHGFMATRGIYGRSLGDLAYPQTLFARAVARYATAEVVALSAARYLHLDPGQMSILSALAKYSVPTLCDEVFALCGNILGARGYSTTAGYGSFEKAGRDAQLVGLFDGNSVVVREQIALQLPKIVQRLDRGMHADGEAEVAARIRSALDLRLDVDLPPADFAELRLSNSGRLDLLLAFRSRARLFAAPQEPGIAALADRVGAELDALAERIAAHGGRRTAPDHPVWFDLAAEFCRLAGAATVALAWTVNGSAPRGPWSAASVRASLLVSLGLPLDQATAGAVSAGFRDTSGDPWPYTALRPDPSAQPAKRQHEVTA